jgi:hypothetical protein
MVESSPVFVDGFGRRVVRVSRDDAPVELLYLDAELARQAGFLDALRERVAKVASLRLTSYARVLRVETDPQGGALIVSEHVKGWRLADLLDVAETENLTFDIGVVMLLLRQLLPTAAMLASQSRDTASGALGPEHLLLTPQGRLVLTDYVLGSAIEKLGWEPERLWRSLRVATPPPETGGRAVSPRGDVAQIGVTMLSLVVGRRLRDDEFPERLEVLVGSARQRTPSVVDAPLSEGLRTWLTRALQLHPRSFGSLFDARLALEQLLATETTLIAQPTELDLAMARLERLMPAFELPALPAVSAGEALFDMPAPAHDWSLNAVAFDRPANAQEPEAPLPPLDLPDFSVTDGGSVEAPWSQAMARSAPASAQPAAPPPISLPPPVAPPQAAPVASAPPAARAPWREEEPVPTAALPAAGSGAPVPDPDHAIAARSTPARPRLAAFDPDPEPVVESDATPIAVAPPWWRSPAAVAAMGLLILGQAALIGWQLTRPAAGLAGDGELVVQSRPEGARVTVDDEDKGQTPVTVRLAPGTHVLQLRVGSAEPRVIPLLIRAGVQTAQYVEMQGVAATGILEVRSDPSRARVTIDGQNRGSTPLTLRDVTPGEYQVVIERSGRTATQVVRVEAGETAQLTVPIR